MDVALILAVPTAQLQRFVQIGTRHGQVMVDAGRGGQHHEELDLPEAQVGGARLLQASQGMLLHLIWLEELRVEVSQIER